MNKMLRLTCAFILALVIVGLPDARRKRHNAGPADHPKDSIQITAFTFNVYKGNYDQWSWVPRMNFRVNGPIASGSQLYVEFSTPTGPWVKFDCHTDNIEKGYWWKTECGGRDIPEDKGSLYTGPVNFTIKMRNELAGTDSVMFSGKMKVAKAHSNEVGPKAANKWVYFVDHDWNLPIGYVYLTPADVHGWKMPDFHVAFWVRGDPYKFDPHLFYQGKEVGKKFFEGTEVGRAGCEAVSRTTRRTTSKTRCHRRRSGPALSVISQTSKAATRPGKLRASLARYSRSTKIPVNTSSNYSGTTNSRGRSNSPFNPAANSTTASRQQTNSAPTS